MLEMAVLLTARAYDQPSEWNNHAPMAVAVGVSRITIAHIAARSRPDELDAAHLAVHDVVTQLLEKGQLDGRTYEAAISTIGESWLVEVIGTVGHYSTLAMMLNSAKIADDPKPAGQHLVIQSAW